MSAIMDMFHVDNPEQAAKLAITLTAIAIGVSIIMFAISILCLAKEALCCVASIMKCFRGMCDCCVSRCCGASAAKDDSHSSSGAGSSGSKQGVGQLMSLVIMVLSILVALVWEFYFATGMDSQAGTADQWSQGCTPDMSSYPQCLKYQAAYRVAFVAAVFFAVMTMVTAVTPAVHNQAWDLKILGYIVLMVGVAFCPNAMFDEHGFIWAARVGAFIFLILQQVILIDSAYCVNEYLVEKGYGAASRPGTEDTWNAWLVACLLLSFGLFAAALAGLVLLLVFYTGCDSSNAFISFTLLSVVTFTALQLFATNPADQKDGGQGHNFLASAVVAAYVVYLCFIAVSANPVGHCNPTYSEKENALALVLGLGITFLSITGTVYFSSKNMAGLVGATSDAPAHVSDIEAVLTGGKVGDGGGAGAGAARPSLTRQVTGGLDSDDGLGGQSYKFNGVMVLIACYWCCVLTDWGNPGGGASAASPTAGTTAMWMNISASWVCSLLYTWTIVAPLVFPGRDFSR